MTSISPGFSFVSRITRNWKGGHITCLEQCQEHYLNFILVKFKAEVMRMERAIVHCDINHCYAQIEEMLNPELKQRPMAVGGSQEERHGIILAKNLHAKKYKIQTGERSHIVINSGNSLHCCMISDVCRVCLLLRRKG